ncbi:MAG: hypothetical protein HYT39_03220 [Candidatus Sungbacteria bacterium]|nr:hypothetical protein [Candidatus Sungbacteria bacterium]
MRLRIETGGIPVTGYEVHARLRGGRIVFRIWDGQRNSYATDEITGADACGRLIRFEGRRNKRLTPAEASRRVQNAKEDGFESPFVTSGELRDPWKQEGRQIRRGI